MSLKVFLGRMNPIHIAHEMVIQAMLDSCGPGDKSVIILGSQTEPMSIRHFFSYTERKQFVRARFPNTPVVGLPDFAQLSDWMEALDDLLRLCGARPAEAVFFGGSDEDTQFYTDAGRKTEIMNRFDGTTPKISASEVRDALIHNRPVDQLLSPPVRELVLQIFPTRWREFCSK